MIVTAIEELSKKKSKIYLDGEFAFVLYKGELRLYHISCGRELPRETYLEIMEKVLQKRARIRAMHLLTKREYTEKQLEDKLKRGFYPAEIVEDALNYVRSYRYTDDLRFAVGYITNHEGDKSRRRIEQDLLLKGIDRATMEQAWLEWEAGGGCLDELKMARRCLEKRHFDPEKADVRELQRAYRYLNGKGFKAEIIQKALRVDWD